MPPTHENHQSRASLLPIGNVVEQVARSYPDVTSSSLRFLQREGLIAPVRTAGGHRLYSTGDIKRILQIKAWQNQRLSLHEIRERLTRLDSLPDLPTIADWFLHQMLDRRATDARRTILGADDVGLPLEGLFGDVIQPAMVDVGQRWERGNLIIAQEKEISELVRELITELTLRHASAQANGPSVVAGCVQDERHELGLRMICGLLRTKGYDVHFLGADVGIRFLLEAVRLHRPVAVLLSAKHEANLSSLMHTVDAIQDSESSGGASRPLIIAGGGVAITHHAELRSRGAIPVTTYIPAECVAVIEAMLPVSRPAEHAGAESD